MLVSEYFIWFLIYSFFGWIFETVYCTIHSGEWENRGFLYGPICPIYGVGAVAITFVYQRVCYFGYHDLTMSHVFLIGFCGSIPLEYGTHWFLEKQFHAYWWDYSDMPLNINGRICLPASLLFGISGVGIIYGSMPVLNDLSASIPPLCREFIALISMGIMSADLTLTVSELTRFAKEVALMEERLNSHMESFVSTIAEKTQDVGLKIAEERERFSISALEEYGSHMGLAYRRALSRAQGFRFPVKEKGLDFFNFASGFLKKFYKRRFWNRK